MFFFQAEDGIRDYKVTGVQTCALPIYKGSGDLMQRLDIAQFQQQMHLIELVLDDIEQGKGPLGAFIQGDDIYNDLRKRITQLQRGIHVAADTTTAVGEAL